MELLKLISAPELVAQIVSFLVLLLLLKVFAWKKFLGVLDKRREKISTELKRIGDAQAEVENLKREFQEKLEHIDETSRQKIQEALDAAKLLAQGIREEAHAQALEILEKNKEEIRLELVKARQQLKGEVVDLTIEATQALIQEKFTAEGDRKLVEDFLRRLDNIGIE